MSSTSVDCTDLENNPKCPHGPTLKFTRCANGKTKVFFACSACRDRKACPFYLEEHRPVTTGQKLTLDQWEKNVLSAIDTERIFDKFRDMLKLTNEERAYCHACESFLIPEEVKFHFGHRIKKDISNFELMHPTKVIRPLTDDKKEAQYWFTSNAIEVLVKALRACRVECAISIGAPSLNEVLRERSFRTFLLDLDKRYMNFYNEEEFSWFNMFNFWFMHNSERSLKSVRDAMNYNSVALIIDPPFGALLEPLAKTVNILQNIYKEERKDPAAELKLFLALPYFMEPNIKTSFGDLKPAKYIVEYINQAKFNERSDKPSRSPVRFFTNVDLKLIPLPESEGYVFCERCDHWVGANAEHCDVCNACPPVHRETYKHCLICNRCVRQSWKHCGHCSQCVKRHHLCEKYRKMLLPS